MKLPKKKAKGKLPSTSWLNKNGYNAIMQCMKNHPELFSHIEQDRMIAVQKTPLEWVKVAEELVKKNSGILPCQHTLRHKYNLSALVRCMAEYPEKFAYIKQESKKGKDPEEWVPIAEKIAKDNGGKLPINYKLVKMGYLSLSQWLKKKPELFSHIPQEVCREPVKKRRLLEEWIEIAEELEKNHGELPNYAWLRKNGYKGMTHSMLKHPEKFKHIKQKKLIDHAPKKSVDEWVNIAIKYEKKNGYIPNNNVLRNNGDRGISDAIKRYPEKFKGMKQEYKNGVRIIGE